MPLKIEPDVDLDELTYSYSPDLLEFFDAHLSGIKYINISKFIMREQYENICFKIIVQEKPQPLQRPPADITPKTLADKVMQLLQYRVQEQDAAGKYRIQVYKHTAKSENVIKSKHIDVSAPSTNNEAKTFIPQEMEQDVLASQAHYIVMLHDQMLKLGAVVTSIIDPLMRQLDKYQESSQKFNDAMVLTNKHTLNFQLAMKAQEDELRLGLIERQNSAKTKEQLMQTLRESGAVSKAMTMIQQRVMGGSGILPTQEQQIEAAKAHQRPKSEPIIKPSFRESVQAEYSQKGQIIDTTEIVKNKNSESQPESQSEPSSESQSEPSLTPEEIKKENEALDQMPLFTYCNCLSVTLQEDPEQEKFIKETLREPVYNSLMKLINSQSEEEAINNLKELQQVSTLDDISGFRDIKEILTDVQNKIVDLIMEYDPK